MSDQFQGEADLYRRGYEAMGAADISEYLALCGLVRQFEAERDALQAFKTWVHTRLDVMGVPAEFPEGLHTREGCRVGDRFDWLEKHGADKLSAWLIAKLKTLGEYYEPPTDGRDVVHEIYGWMHVLCFHYVQNRREVKEYDAARRAAKQQGKLLERLVAAVEAREWDAESETAAAIEAARTYLAATKAGARK